MDIGQKKYRYVMGWSILNYYSAFSKRSCPKIALGGGREPVMIFVSKHRLNDVTALPAELAQSPSYLNYVKGGVCLCNMFLVCSGVK